MYETDSSVILATMLANVTPGIDTSEGSFIYDALSPVAKEKAISNGNLNDVLNRVFAITAAANGFDSDLDGKCAEFGITRKDGVLATGQVTFVGSETTVIPIGTIVQTVGGLEYVTTVDGIITGGVAIVNIEAIEISPDYDVPANTIIQVSLDGITSVTNSLVTSGGANIESNEDLLARLLLQVQSPSTSGNVANYTKWALEVDGIGKAQIFPLWAGNGTVKICAVDSNMQPLSSDLLTALGNHIESVRPIGATLTYESATALPINLVVTIVRDTAYTIDQITVALTTALISYLDSIYYKQNYVSYAKIGDLVFNTPGVTDYSDLAVNGGTVNIAVGGEQVAIQGTINVT